MALQETNTSNVIAPWFVVFKLSSLAHTRIFGILIQFYLIFGNSSCFSLRDPETWWLYSIFVIHMISKFQFSVHNSFPSSADVDNLYENANNSSLFTFLFTWLL